MLTFAQYISDIAQEEIVLTTAEVQKLKARFGETVGRMGHLKSDGSLIVDASLIRESALSLGRRELLEAAGTVAEPLMSPQAAKLIERISELNRARYRALCQRYQDATDANKIAELKAEIMRQTFPS